MGNQGAGLQIAGVTDARQFIPQAGAVDAQGVQRHVEVQATRMHQRTHHVRLVAHTFFIGKGRHRDRARREHAGLAKGPLHGKPGQHAIAAVQRTGVGHTVDVRTDHQRRLLVAVRTQGAENIADPVDAYFQVQRLHPAQQLVAAGLVGIGQGDPGAAVLSRLRADFAQQTDLQQQGLAIERQGGGRGERSHRKNSSRVEWVSA
ncbi:hypothetical protein D3C84_780110 [compost metagenome]